MHIAYLFLSTEESELVSGLHIHNNQSWSQTKLFHSYIQKDNPEHSYTASLQEEANLNQKLSHRIVRDLVYLTGYQTFHMISIA